MSSHTWDSSFYTSMIGRLLFNNELENLDKQILLPRFSSTVEIINTFMRCVHRYERESVTVEAIFVVSLNYGHCDTATRNSPTKWALRVTVTQLLKKGAMGWVVFSFKAPSFFTLQRFYVVHIVMAISCM